MKKLRWILFYMYCVFVVWVTVLTRESSANHEVELSLFWAYRRYFTGARQGQRVVIQNLQNIVFFLPFGVLMPLKKWWIVGIAALVLSLSVEITQYVGGYGLAELDDVICNVLGAVIGFAIVAFFRKRVALEE